MKAKRKARSRDTRAAAPERAITAQPTQERMQQGHRVVPESGLAVDAEDLGTPFLSDATEQGNFEGELQPDMMLSDPPPTDDALLSPELEADASVWDQTIRRAPESDIREIINPRVSDEDPIDAESVSAEEEDAMRVDLHRERVVDASLFDREAPDSDEVQSPELDTEDDDE